MINNPSVLKRGGKVNEIAPSTTSEGRIKSMNKLK